MKVHLKLFYNPLNIMPVQSFGVIHTAEYETIKLVEEFAKKEFEKLNFGY